MKLDEVDAQLVETLREDGRASFETLAGRTGLSRKVARSRVLRLFEEGVLRVVATVRPEYDGVHAIAHLSVGVVAARRDEVAQALAAYDESAFVSIVSGGAGVVAEIRTSDLVRLRAVVEQARSIAGVRRLETLVYAGVAKEPHLPPPLAEEQALPTLDDLDRMLVRLLRADGRASYAELAGRVGLSAAATRARVRHLLEGGVIRIVALVNPTKLGRSFMTGFSLELDGPAGPVERRLTEIGAVDFLARTLGGSDLIGTIVTSTPEDTIDVLDRIGTIEGIAEMRTWTHLRLVQERYATVGEDGVELPSPPVR